MRVLIIPSWYPNKNNHLLGIFFKEQAEALTKQKDVKVDCIALNESSFRYIFTKKTVFSFFSKNSNGVFEINLLYPMANRFKAFRNFVRLQIFKILFKRYIKKQGRPDIVHVHSFLHGNLALWIKKYYKIDYVVTEHSTGFARNIYSVDELKYAQNIYKNSKLNLAVSDEFAKLLEQKIRIKFKFLPNSIDTNFFSLKNSLQKDTFNFINVAFLDKKKNQALLIEAFAKVFRREQNVNLCIVGNGQEETNLVELIDKLDMQEKITLYGKASRDEIKSLLHNSDAFVLSSKYETFGVVIIEAMSCGLPVLSTRCGGPESIVKNEKLGLLVENDNLEALSNGLEKVYKISYDKNYIRDYVVKNFSSSAVSEKLLKEYKNIVEK